MANWQVLIDAMKRVVPTWMTSFGMRVPPGGSNCAKCEYVDGQNCKQKDFIKWNDGSPVIPLPVDEYCCNAYSIGKQAKKLVQISEK